MRETRSVYIQGGTRLAMVQGQLLQACEQGILTVILCQLGGSGMMVVRLLICHIITTHTLQLNRALACLQAYSAHTRMQLLQVVTFEPPSLTTLHMHAEESLGMRLTGYHACIYM
jgi:hypothetical protein